MRVLPRRFQVALFERDGDVLRKPDADEAAGGDGVAVANQRDGFARGDDLAVLERVQRFEKLPLVGRGHRTQYAQTGSLARRRASSGIGIAFTRRYFCRMRW